MGVDKEEGRERKYCGFALFLFFLFVFTVLYCLLALLYILVEGWNIEARTTPAPRF